MEPGLPGTTSYFSQSGCSVRRKSNTNRIQRQSGIIHLLVLEVCPAGGIIRNPRDPPCRALDVRKAGEGRRKRHVGLRPDGAAARHARADASSRRPRVAAGHQKRKVDDAPRRVEFEEVRIGVRAQHVDGEVCLLYTSPSPRDGLLSRMPSSA